MSKTYVKISEDLLDQLVNELTKLPWRDVNHLFQLLGEDLEEGKEDIKPQFLLRK